jgi:hypothetical protein
VNGAAPVAIVALVTHAVYAPATDRERVATVLLRELASRTLEGMTRHLTGQLLREPLVRLGRDADDRDGRAIGDIFAL